MLFKRPILDGIAAGDVDLAFRSWKRPTVKPGSHLRTAIGVVAIDAVEPVNPATISDEDARRAGFLSRDALLKTLTRRPGSASADDDAQTRDFDPADSVPGGVPGVGASSGSEPDSADDRIVYRIELHLAGPDPRVALRRDADLGPDQVADLVARLQRLDRHSRRGPWTRATLELIAARPATRAVELAGEVELPRDRFKADVRKLKELGLTESLDIGYRLSPRGEALLRLWV